MAEIRKRKTRMYEPWGYRDENNYQGASIILDNDLDSFFADVSYNKDDNKIHFANKDGEEKATLDVAEFVKSDSIVERAWYEDGKIYVKFTNGDVITIDVEELIDQNEFADGLQVNEGIVSVLIDGESEAFLSVSSNGVKVSGVQEAIDIEKDRAISAETALDEKIDQEIEDRIGDVNEEETRAISAETALDEKIDNEIARATSAETALDQKIDAETARALAAEGVLQDNIDAEEARATSAEETLTTNLATEIQRAKDAEHALDVRIDTLNDALTNEKTRATAAEQELSTRLTTEIQDRKDDVDAEEARATSAETALNAKIDQEIADRINAVENEQEARVAADNRLQEAITSEVSRATSAETQLNNKIDQEIANREADVDAEEARATSAETALNNKIDDEISDREAEAVASAEYVSEDVKIYLKNKNGDTLSTIDASDFIADGMIENVQLVESGSTSVLVITWNTDGGSKVTRLDVGDIFEADNYYTKIEVDDIKEALQDEIDSEEIRATSAETILNTAIAAETTRAEGAEGDLQDAIDAETARATSAETDLNVAIAEEASTARAAEEANASAITTEKTRAEGAESNLQSAIADEATTARAAEQANATAIAAEQTRAEEAEALKANAADVYTKGEVDGKETALQAGINSNTAAIAAEETRAEDAEQVLQDNIDAEETRAKAEEAKKVDRQVNGTNGKALIFNETDGGGAKFENSDGINSFVGVNDAGANGIDAQIYAINKDTKEGSRIDVSNTGVYYTVGSDSPAIRMVADNEIATKGNINAAVSGKANAADVYTKGEVDAIISQLLTRIENIENG